MSTAMHRLKLRSILQVGRSDGTGFCSTVGTFVGDKVRFVELVAVEFSELVAVEFKVGFIVDDDFDGFMDGDTDCIRVPDGEMDGTSEDEDTADELFKIVTLGSIDGTADGSISLGESVGHVLASPKRIICSKLVLPLLLPLGPAKAWPYHHKLQHIPQRCENCNIHLDSR